MPFYTWRIVLIPAAVGIAGIIVFLSQHRSRRATAVIGLEVAMFAALALCALTFLGGRFLFSPLSARKNALGGFPFPVGTTWVYLEQEYQQAIGDPTSIITATNLITETVVRAEGDGPSQYNHDRSLL